MPDSTDEGAPKAKNQALKFAQDVFAGTCGGIAVTLTGHPFGGVLDCAKKTIQWEGPFGLYKGVQSPLAGQMFFRAALFSALGSSKRWLATNPDGSKKALSISDCYVAGAMAGGAGAFFEGPIDFYKSQVQVQIIRSKADPAYKPPFTSISDCVKKTIAANGVRAPFQGLGATLSRNIPANAAYLGSFEHMKMAAAESRGCAVSELPAWLILSAGGLGGIFYWTLIFPVDVIKSSMQTDAIKKPERKYPTIASAASKLWAEGGVGRFYRGFTPCIIRAAPANAAMLFTVDAVNNMLGNS